MHTAWVAQRLPEARPTATRSPIGDIDLLQANDLLAAFPPQALARLAPHLRLLHLPRQHVLHECGLPIGDVYFPVDSIIALLYVMENGDSLQTAMVGREGMIGMAGCLDGPISPGCAVMQREGRVLRLRGSVLAGEAEREPAILRLLLNYTQSQFFQLAQSLVCRRHHSVENQFCWWLLSTLDRSSDNEIFVTHEMLAGMMGVRREGVTEAAVRLQRLGIIRYRRGHISFIDRAALERRACACYDTVKSQTSPLSPSARTRPAGDAKPACVHAGFTGMKGDDNARRLY